MKTDDKLIFEQYRTVTENKRQNPVVDEHGDKFWYNERGELHREDGPAYEGADDAKEWWVRNRPYFTIPEWTKALFIYKGHTPEKLGQERFNDLVRAFAQRMEDKYEN